MKKKDMELRVNISFDGEHPLLLEKTFKLLHESGTSHMVDYSPIGIVEVNIYFPIDVEIKRLKETTSIMWESKMTGEHMVLRLLNNAILSMSFEECYKV